MPAPKTVAAVHAPPLGFEPDAPYDVGAPPPGFEPDTTPMSVADRAGANRRANSRMSAAKSQPGAFSGFFSQLGVTPDALRGTLDAINPIAQAGHALDSARTGHPGDAFNRAVQSGLSLVPGGGLAVPLIEHLASDPYELIQRGDAETSPSKRAGYAAASLVPVLGRQIADIGEEYGTNTPHAIGRTVGLLAPMLAGAGGTPEGATPKFNSARIRPTPEGLIPDLLERSLPGSIPFRAHRAAALEDAARIGNDLADRISKSNATPEQLGNQITQQVTVARTKAARALRSAKSEIDDLATPQRRSMRVRDSTTGDLLEPDSAATAGREFVNPKHAPDGGQVPVADPSTGAWVDTEAAGWKPLTRELKKIDRDPHRTLTEPDRAALHRLVTELDANPRMLPWDTAQRTAAAARKFIRDNNDIAPTALGDAGAKMNKLLDSGMENALGKVDPALPVKWRQYQRLEASTHKAFIGGTLDNLAKTKPEAIPQLITSPSFGLEDVRVMQSHLGRTATRDMAAQNIRGALENFAHHSDPQALATDLRRLMTDNGQQLDMAHGKMALAIDDPTTVRAIDQFVEDASKAHAPHRLATSPLSPGNLGLEAAAMASRHMGPVGHAITTGLAPLTYGAAKMVLSPDMWTSMRNGLGKAGAAGVATGTAGAITAPPESATKPRANSGRL